MPIVASQRLVLKSGPTGWGQGCLQAKGFQAVAGCCQPLATADFQGNVLKVGQQLDEGTLIFDSN